MGYSLAKSLQVEYDELMCGKRRTFSSSHFGKRSSENCVENAKIVIKYALDTYIGWPVEVMFYRLDMSVMSKLKLVPIIKYLKIPPEYDRDRDTFYILSVVYDRYIPGKRSRTVHMYERALEGKVQKFPKEYFSGPEGRKRAIFCLQYLVNQKYPFMSPEELYAESGKPSWTTMLKESRLYPICKAQFGDPVTFLHASLSVEQRDDFMYHYMKYMHSLILAMPRKKQEETSTLTGRAAKRNILMESKNGKFCNQ